MPASDPNNLGMLGMHGTYEANMAMHESDLIIAIGARFDDRVTGKLAQFCPHAKVIHIDVDPASISKNVKVDVPIVGQVKPVLKDMLKVLSRAQDQAGRRSAQGLVAAHRGVAQRGVPQVPALGQGDQAPVRHRDPAQVTRRRESAMS